MIGRSLICRTPLRRRSGIGLLGAAVLALALLVLAALPAVAPAAADDWRHEWEVLRLVTYLQQQDPAPQGAMIYDLGDSIARESVISDSTWTTQLANRAAKAGKAAPRAFTLAGHNQTFGMDEQLVAAIPVTPAGQPRGIVLIGVGISRFIGPPLAATTVDLDPPSPGVEPDLSPWERHVYDGRKPLSIARKKELIPRWMERRWAGFRANRARNFASITRIIQLCKAKGLRPVLIDQPLDMKLVGSGLDRPRLSIRSGCATLVNRYGSSHGVRYVRFTRSVGIPTRYYWDMHHLLTPGARLWQSRLSAELVKLL